MKNLFTILGLVLLLVSTSCTTVSSGHKGVKVSWGGETDMQKVYPEGMDMGLNWIFDDMIEYDAREKTLVEAFEFNDKDNMTTRVEFALDFRYDPKKINFLHKNISDVMLKISKTLKSAGKEVVPQYSAVELNITERAVAESKMSAILKAELPEFYTEFIRIQMTDVDIPKKVAELAEQTAVQIGKNELAAKKKSEQEGLAAAKVAEAQGNYDANVLNLKIKKLASTPEILKLKELEVEMEFAKQGKSRYGNNNVFGGETAIVRGLK